jgi:YegS/Rv2252/BmrU family lipid kinase
MLQARGLAPCVRVSEGIGHVYELARSAIHDGVRTVVAWGGDGTVNEVAAALTFTDARMAIVPVGSGNGLARGLGIPLRAERALDVALQGPTRAIDVGEVDGRYFVNVAGFGIDAAIAHRFAERGLERRGLRRYVELALSEVRAYRCLDYRITTGDVSLAVRPLLLTLANGTEFGNGAVVAANARPDDGRLDLVVAAERGLLTAIVQAPRLFFGGITTLPGVTAQQVSAVTVSADVPIRYHVDGEPGTGGMQVHARIHPLALQVAVPTTLTR